LQGSKRKGDNYSPLFLPINPLKGTYGQILMSPLQGEGDEKIKKNLIAPEFETKRTI
jgi:hypothetical protein